MPKISLWSPAVLPVQSDVGFFFFSTHQVLLRRCGVLRAALRGRQPPNRLSAVLPKAFLKGDGFLGFFFGEFCCFGFFFLVDFFFCFFFIFFFFFFFSLNTLFPSPFFFRNVCSPQPHPPFSHSSQVRLFPARYSARLFSLLHSFHIGRSLTFFQVCRLSFSLCIVF